MRKFSERYINDHSVLSLFKIGFEFEFFTNKLSYYKLLEQMNQEFEPIVIHGYRKYHSSFNPTDIEWKIEPDLSGGSNMVELVTGPMGFYEAKIWLIKICKFIDTWCYTTDKSGVHINVSFDSDMTDFRLSDVNVLKLITRTDEDYIYSIFPSRQNNIYAKSVKKLIPFEDYDFSNVEISSIQNNIKLPSDKYYGINLLNMISDNIEGDRIEYRYIGGENYENYVGDISDLMSKFCIDIYDNVSGNFSQEDIDNISDFLEDNINSFKSFLNYDNFLVEYPKVTLQINQDSNYDIINSYFSRIHKKLFKLLNSIEILEPDGNVEQDKIINFYTKEDKIEVVDFTFNSIQNLDRYEFIKCDIKNGIFNKCGFINSDVFNAEVNGSKVENTMLDNCRVMNSNCDKSNLQECYFINGYLNSKMDGGVFRSGKIGPYGELSETTKIVNNINNFFGTIDGVDDKDKIKKNIK